MRAAGFNDMLKRVCAVIDQQADTAKADDGDVVAVHWADSIGNPCNMGVAANNQVYLQVRFVLESSAF